MLNWPSGFRASVQDLALSQWLALGTIVIVFGAILIPRRRAPRRPYPPGPKGLPLLGNAFQMPVDRRWLVYRDWAKKYGI